MARSCIASQEPEHMHDVLFGLVVLLSNHVPIVFIYLVVALPIKTEGRLDSCPEVMK